MYAVSIRVLNQGIRIQQCYLNSVMEPVLVGISFSGIGFVDIDFLAVT